mmetsp:Transcript_45625/g.116749  ORF Transcript_45625/g.116749 Transcript_45625/m.116749 type:complete len:215 (+) Transcript_45625:597-1241(+)
MLVPCRMAMTLAVAVPDGKGSCSRTMTCSRSGTAKKTPKKASAAPQASICGGLSQTPPPGGFSSGVSCCSAGMMPTKPAASGIVAVATAVVCTITFSAALKPAAQPRPRSRRKKPKPSSADCRLPIVTHPVCRPKYMLVQHRMEPTPSPATTERTVMEASTLGAGSAGAGAAGCARRPGLLPSSMAGCNNARPPPPARLCYAYSYVQAVSPSVS